MGKDMSIGIYKITSPSGRIYIGQSKRIERRFRDYKLLRQCNKQILLYRSFSKYGVENHSFEILEICSIELLNNRERYWQEYYQSANGGLNCVYINSDDKKKEYSIESKKKMSINRTGDKNHMFGRKGKDNPQFGRKQSEEQRAKYSPKRKGVAKPKGFGEKVAQANRTRVISEETRKKISDSAKKRIGALNPFFGRRHSKETREKIRLHHLKTAS